VHRVAGGKASFISIRRRVAGGNAGDRRVRPVLGGPKGEDFKKRKERSAPAEAESRSLSFQGEEIYSKPSSTTPPSGNAAGVYRKWESPHHARARKQNTILIHLKERGKEENFYLSQGKGGNNR